MYSRKIVVTEKDLFPAYRSCNSVHRTPSHKHLLKIHSFASENYVLDKMNLEFEHVAMWWLMFYKITIT